MLTKEVFKQVITELQSEDEKVEKLEVALSEFYCDSGYVFRCNLYKSAIIKLLKILLVDDIDLIDWWYYEAYPEFLESGDIESISNFNENGNVYKTFKSSDDIYNYLQERMNLKFCKPSINDTQFEEIVDLIIKEDVAEDKINTALDLLGIDNKRESNYRIILTELLKKTIDSDEYVKWWTEAMCEYRRQGDKAISYITIVDANNTEHIIKKASELYEFIGAEL